MAKVEGFPGSALLFFGSVVRNNIALIAVIAVCAPCLRTPDLEVVVFLGTECPMARLYANRLNTLSERYPQVRFRVANASQQDSESEVVEFGKLFHFPASKDYALARRLGAEPRPRYDRRCPAPVARPVGG